MGQRCFRTRRGAAFRVPAGDRRRAFEADLEVDAFARDEIFPPAAARRVAPVMVFLVVRLVVLLVAFATAFFPVDRPDRGPVFSFAAPATRWIALADRLETLAARLTVLDDRFAVLLVRLTVVGERIALLDFRGVDVISLFAGPAARLASFTVFLPAFVTRLAPATRLDRFERYVIVNRISSPTA